MSNTLKVIRKSAASDGTQPAAEASLEARRSPRRAYDRPIGVLLHGAFQIFRATQLGEGGLAFNAEKKIPVQPDASGKFQDLLVITIILPGVAEGIVARADIAYENSVEGGGFQYGVQFLNMPLHVRRIIRNYVTAKTQEEAERELHAHYASQADAKNSEN